MERKNVLNLILMMLLFVMPINCTNNDDSETGSDLIKLSSANWTEKGYFDGLLYYKIISNSERSVEISRSEKTVTSVIVPQFIIIENIKYIITSIGDEAFFRCNDLTSVQLPQTITSIGALAFRECYNLQSIDLPDNLQTIKYQAFGWCRNITSVKIPNAISNIPDEAFYGCKNLCNIKLHNNVKNIGHWAFYDCEIKDLYCQAEIVPKENDSFDGNILKATLHVPANSIDAYKAMPPWSMFQSIIPLK